ncbi:hypothetical protein [Dankookia sp. P2]|uniref:hypothetical protein n=1 Tax=Dankookia sp. P2 TaxID=3423955 RepID=UPI003D667533
MDQAEILQAIGIPERFSVRACPSFWMCGTPAETAAGAEAARFSVEAARDSSPAPPIAARR